jgi:hypothetical protein
MGADERPLGDDPRIRVLRFDAVAQGITIGTLAGLAVFVATNWLVLKGGDVVGPNLALLAQFFYGYRVTFLGSFVGFAWAFFYGGLAGYVLSRVYNRIVEHREYR